MRGKMNPTVSVIIPAYNAGRWISETLESVLAQTYRELDVVVVDDGSTDDTRARVAAFGSCVRCIAQKRQGVYAARNRGLRETCGPLVAFLDADDVWEAEKIAEQVTFLQRHPDYAAVHTDASLLDVGGRILKTAVNPRRQSGDGWVFEEFFAQNMAVVLMSTVMIRRVCFDVVGLFDEQYPSVADQFFFLRLALRYPIGFIPRPLVRYRLTPKSLSRKDVAENLRIRERLLHEFLDQHAAVFVGREALVRQRWRSFYRHAGWTLWHAGHFRTAHGYFRQALGSGEGSVWAAWLITFLPERWLRSLFPRRNRGEG